MTRQTPKSKRLKTNLIVATLVAGIGLGCLPLLLSAAPALAEPLAAATSSATDRRPDGDREPSVADTAESAVAPTEPTTPPLQASQEPLGVCVAANWEATAGINSLAGPCGRCDSEQGFCSNGGGSSGTQCNQLCQQLVSEDGFCSLACDCCICPDVP